MENALVSSYIASILVHSYYCISYRPKEEGQNNDELESGSIIGIVIACAVAALLILILIIVSAIAVLHERKKRMGKANVKSTNPNIF